MSWNLEESVEYYRRQGAPGDQNALIALLKEIQQENGGSIPAWAVSQAAESLGSRESLLHALIKRVPSLRLANTHTLELCAGPNCGKHTLLADYAEKLCKEKGITFRFMPCMRMCGKGPNVKWDGKVYHQMSEEKIRSLLSEK